MRYRYLLGCLLALTAEVSGAARAPQDFLPPELSACRAQTRVTAAIPPNGAPIPDPASGGFSNGFYHVQEVAPGFYYATDGLYQSAFVISRQGIMVIDAPPSIGANPVAPAQSVSIVDVIYSVRAARGLPIRKLIYSHAHLDHIGQASKILAAFPNVEIIAHEETAATIARSTGEQPSVLANAGSVPPPAPTRTFKRFWQARLGDKFVNLHYDGAVHEPGNIYIHAPQERVLMHVDVLFPGSSQFTALSSSSDLPRFIGAFDRMLEFKFDVFIGGHNNRLGTRADVIEGRNYVRDMRTNARAAFQNTAPAAIFGILPNNTLAAAAIFLDELACTCANLTLNPATTPSKTDWVNRLTAADLLTVTHCAALVLKLRTDPAL